MIQVQYYGFIKQQTGEDWENAKLSLSTAQPSIGGSPPDLPTRILRFRRLVPWSYHQYLQSSCNGTGLQQFILLKSSPVVVVNFVRLRFLFLESKVKHEFESAWHRYSILLLGFCY